MGQLHLEVVQYTISCRIQPYCNDHNVWIMYVALRVCNQITDEGSQ